MTTQTNPPPPPARPTIQAPPDPADDGVETDVPSPDDFTDADLQLMGTFPNARQDAPPAAQAAHALARARSLFARHVDDLYEIKAARAATTGVQVPTSAEVTRLSLLRTRHPNPGDRPSQVEAEIQAIESRMNAHNAVPDLQRKAEQSRADYLSALEGHKAALALVAEAEERERLVNDPEYRAQKAKEKLDADLLALNARNGRAPDGAELAEYGHLVRRYPPPHHTAPPEIRKRIASIKARIEKAARGELT